MYTWPEDKDEVLSRVHITYGVALQEIELEGIASVFPPSNPRYPSEEVYREDLYREVVKTLHSSGGVAGSGEAEGPDAGDAGAEKK